MMRARINTWRLEASVAVNVPKVNNDIANTKIGRVFNLCSKKPVTGMTTDTVRRNAVVNHCTAPAVTLRSRMSRGIATAMSVSLRITTNVATRRRLMTSLLRPTVSATTVVPTLSADRLVTLSELLVKYPPAMYNPRSPKPIVNRTETTPLDDEVPPRDLPKPIRRLPFAPGLWTRHMACDSRPRVRAKWDQ